MVYKKGMRVIHPSRESWGVGEVLADISGSNLDVFFCGYGRVTLSTDYIEPIVVTGEQAEEPMLDNLKHPSSSTTEAFQSIEKSISRFLELFPAGFQDQAFIDSERAYKEKAHRLMKDILGPRPFVELLEAGNYDEITRRALKVVNATNLIFPNEKMALKDGLADPEAQEQFAKSLYSLLYDVNDLSVRFEAFTSVLEEIGAAKWTIATYFPFITDPTEYMFLKPTVTRQAAEKCAFEINYQPQLNWLTYHSFNHFAKTIREKIASLEPQDMIDVQSFIWSISPDTYGGKSA